MAKVKIQGNASGTGVLTVTAPNTSTDRTITLPDATGTLLNSDGSGANLSGVAALDGNSNLGVGTTSPTNLGNYKTIATNDSSGGMFEIMVGGTRTANIQSSASQCNIQTRTNIPIAFDINSTEKMRVTSDGLTFNGDTAAANALDDYEEGTWTPVWTPDGGTIVTNTTYSGGVYTKVGNLVTIHCRLYTSSVSSPTGKITISGLPYAIKNSPYATPYVTWPLLGLNASLAGEPRAKALGNTTTLQLSDWVWGTTESGSNIADKFDNDVWCHAGLTYMTN